MIFCPSCGHEHSFFEFLSKRKLPQKISDLNVMSLDCGECGGSFLIERTNAAVPEPVHETRSLREYARDKIVEFKQRRVKGSGTRPA